jgi:hypothetical protein
LQPDLYEVSPAGYDAVAASKSSKKVTVAIQGLAIVHERSPQRFLSRVGVYDGTVLNRNAWVAGYFGVSLLQRSCREIYPYVGRSMDVRLLKEAGLERRFLRPNLNFCVCVGYRRECPEMIADSESGS